MSKRDKQHLGDLDLDLDLDIQKLFKEFKSESQQIQETLSDIKDLLERSKNIMKQLLQISDERNQEVAFFNVAPAPPAAPLTQIIAKDIARIARQIRIKQRELDNAFALFLLGVVLNNPFVVFIGLLDIATTREELQALRDELEQDIVLLLTLTR